MFKRIILFLVWYIQLINNSPLNTTLLLMSVITKWLHKYVLQSNISNRLTNLAMPIQHKTGHGLSMNIPVRTQNNNFMLSRTSSTLSKDISKLILRALTACPS